MREERASCAPHGLRSVPEFYHSNLLHTPPTAKLPSSKDGSVSAIAASPTSTLPASQPSSVRRAIAVLRGRLVPARREPEVGETATAERPPPRGRFIVSMDPLAAYDHEDPLAL